MKKSKILILAVLTLLIVPMFAVPTFANPQDEDNANRSTFDESKAQIISQNIRYFKTVEAYRNVERDSYGNIISGDLLGSETYEMTKEEWDQTDFDDNTQTRDQTTIVTAYKMMTAALLYDGNTYRYRNELSWMSFPAVRSYDVIGIGHANNVTAADTPSFTLEYITEMGLHFYGLFNYQQSFSNGKSATFTLPLEELQSLTITYYFDVKKIDQDETITYQEVYGDYAHGIDTSITFSDAINHDVIGSLGIQHDYSVWYMFDTIDEADVYWNGIW